MSMADNDELRSRIRQLEYAKHLFSKSELRQREHIEKLETLARDLWLQLLNAYDYKEVDEFAERMAELEIEVDE